MQNLEKVRGYLFITDSTGDVFLALKFYFDTHVAKAAATQLRAKNIEVTRCEEVGLAEADDEVHLAYATSHGYIMVSQDSDFLVLDTHWKKNGKSHGGIMFVPVHLQGSAQISFVVEQLAFYHQAEQADAVDYRTEIFNRVLYL